MLKLFNVDWEEDYQNARSLQNENSAKSILQQSSYHFLEIDQLYVA